MKPDNRSPGSLRSVLDHEPQPLKFGTSGRRGEVVHLSQLEIYLNARAELDYLLSLPATGGGIHPGQDFYLAHDLRPSSTRFVPEQGGRGRIVQAIERAIRDAGLRPVNLGAVPTPALTAFALARGCGSIMVTGSHIPFDRNGYKTNSAKGELLKQDEEPINRLVIEWRGRLYGQPFEESPFAPNGDFKVAGSEGASGLDFPSDKEQTGPANIELGTAVGRDAYLRRYLDFFQGDSLKGLRLVVYQHSAVGRDLLVDLLRALGAEVIPAGRSETFVPIDTEAIDDATLENIRTMAQEVANTHGRVDALVSTDGDSDRPLLAGISCDSLGRCVARFFPGDLVGMVVAEFLGADAVVVPVSCNDAIDRGVLCSRLEPKTRIGSPFVIAGMEAAVAKGRHCVCGWEANGGFLTGSDIVRNGRVLPALPTRDAFLPILCVLFRMKEAGQGMGTLFDALPRRFSRAALVRNFPRATSQKIVAALTPPRGESGKPDPLIRDWLQKFFPPGLGFSAVDRVDYTDGVRVCFTNGDVAHIRPSGNADEFRIYAVADSQARADEIAQLGIATPDGILRRMEQAFANT